LARPMRRFRSRSDLRRCEFPSSEPEKNEKGREKERERERERESAREKVRERARQRETKKKGGESRETVCKLSLPHAFFIK